MDMIGIDCIPKSYTDRLNKIGTILTAFVVVLGIWGIVQAILASILSAQTLSTAIDKWGRSVAIENKASAYYLLHAGSIATLILSGVIAAINGGYAKLDTAGRIAFWVIILWAVLWAIVAYEYSEMTSPVVLSATGPFVWISTIIIFVGMEPHLWSRLGWVLDLILACIALLSIGSLVSPDCRLASGILRTNQYFSLLFWYGGFRSISRTYRGWVWIMIDISMLGLLGILALWLQRRSWVIDTAILITMYLASLAGRISKVRVAGLVRPLAIGLLVVAVPLVMWKVWSVREAASGFLDRIYDDTRTEQYRIFFSQVRPEDLIFGLGPKATYAYGPDNPEYQFLDNAYLWMAFIGGLPILFSYTVLIVRPGLLALLKWPKDPIDRACALMLLIWTLVLAGLSVYSCPSLSPYSYLICLMAGAFYRSNNPRSIKDRLICR